MSDDAFGRAQKELERARRDLCPSYKRGERSEMFDQHIKLAQTEALIEIAESLRQIHSLIDGRWI